MSLQRALFVLVAIAQLAGLVPAGLVLHRRLASTLEARAREDLLLAPALLADREAMRADAMMMHAKDLASSEGLAEALQRGDRAFAGQLVEVASGAFDEDAVLVGSGGEVWAGPEPTDALVQATRRGLSPVELISDGAMLRRMALAPVVRQGVWLGAAGVARALDLADAGTLAGLTRSEVVILLAGGDVTASTAEEELSAAVAEMAAGWRDDGQVHGLRLGSGRRYLVASAALGDVGAVAFVRDLDGELAVLPELRRVAALAGLWALAIALILGSFLAAMLARPVRTLARAADRLAEGNFEAPLEGSLVREVDRVAQAFAEMRRALAARIDEVETANRELAERQRRLSALQAELIQRDRLAASGRMVTELAHEIRNPVANVRNCLEVIRRRVDDDPTGRRFADLAIDELLRMHELAERMLDLNRPRDPDVRQCDAAAVAGEVAALVRAGATDERLEVAVHGEESAGAAIPPDALKQVLLNVMQNAREAVSDRGRIDLTITAADSTVVLEVLDDGSGVPSDVLEKVFDPFFTTKVGLQGVGLGLFVAEGMIRTYGGWITASNRDDGRGARFRIELIAADRAPAEPGADRPDRFGGSVAEK
jgi:signal transduction histidine kinase